MHNSEENKDIQEMVYKIINDHILYSCSVDTLKMWRQRAGMPSFEVSENERKNMVLRKEIVKHIRNRQSHLAFSLLQEEKVLDSSKEEDKRMLALLGKLSFVDYILGKKIEVAIEFAKTHLEKTKDLEKLYSLIGYEKITDELIEKMSGDVKRDSISNSINSHLFYKLTGRRCSLLHSAVDYYNTLVNVQK